MTNSDTRTTKDETRREVAERIAAVALDPWHVDDEYVSGLADTIEAALKAEAKAQRERDAQLVADTVRHLAEAGISEHNWYMLSNLPDAIRNGE